MVMKFKKIAIIGKYPSLEETKDIHDQLIQLINHLSKKNIDLVIEEKTQNQIKLNKFKSLPLSEIAKQVDINFLNQNDRGAHVNISAIGIAKYSKSVANAHKLIIFLLSKESQEWYAKVNNEYPVNENASTTDLLDSWGKIKLDDSVINKLGDLNTNAVKLMDRVGWQ